MPTMFSFFRKNDRFTLKHLQQIYSQLQQLTFATKQQRTQAVEMIKQISELMVFADKHADALFDFFCEKNMMALFWEILQADCGTEVRVQIIQTVSILLQNVRN